MGLLHCCLSSPPPSSTMGSVSSGNLSTLSPSMEGSLVELYEEVLARGTYEKIGRDAEGWGWIPQPQSEISDLECALLVEAIHGLATDAGGLLVEREMQRLGDSL